MTKKFFSVWKKVFSNWRYVALTVTIAVVFYLLNVIIKSYDSLITFYSQVGFSGIIKLFFTFFIGFKETTTFGVIIWIIIIGIFWGLLISLIAYKTRMIKSVSRKTGFFATTGIFLGVLAPGCAACGIGLLSLFGISAATLTFLPYNGLELSAISAVILLVLVFKITKDINKEFHVK